MCGIGGIVDVTGAPIDHLDRGLAVMNRRLAHRGPDGSGRWTSPSRHVGLAHRRLAVFDLSEAAAQPMRGEDGSVLVFNGSIYNYRELRTELRGSWSFRSTSDTECILAAYARWGNDCVDHLRGMFAFAIWDERRQRLFCARDRLGIKPFLHARVGSRFLFASEAKALLPFLPGVATDPQALAEYFVLQCPMGERTLFDGIHQLLPGHRLVVEGGASRIDRYWDLDQQLDVEMHEEQALEILRRRMSESIDLHGRGDVAVGSYLSGGIDSSLVHLLATAPATGDAGDAAGLEPGHSGDAFHGRFPGLPGYDESHFAELVADASSSSLHVEDLGAEGFRRDVARVIEALDFPIAGPGSFPQFAVSRAAAKRVKVVLGGQGGDELFGGYARYLVAHLEGSLADAIDGGQSLEPSLRDIAGNLTALREYRPLLSRFWQDDLFGPLPRRYLRLIDRSLDLGGEVNWNVLDRARVFDDFVQQFGEASDDTSDVLDRMTRFDQRVLLPALLHVEDRVSMAHGLESRLPFLDHPLVEFAGTVPARLKLGGGSLKHLLKTAFGDVLPAEVRDRRDKLGFPVPLQQWFTGELEPFVLGVVESLRDRDLPYLESAALGAHLEGEQPFSRRTWALLSLELWQQTFHDHAAGLRRELEDPT